jgi:hypothetical protein
LAGIDIIEQNFAIQIHILFENPDQSLLQKGDFSHQVPLAEDDPILFNREDPHSPLSYS